MLEEARDIATPASTLVLNCKQTLGSDTSPHKDARETACCQKLPRTPLAFPLPKMFVLKPAAVGAMVAFFALFCAGGAAADKGSFTSLVAQLDDPLMKESAGSMQAQLSSLT